MVPAVILGVVRVAGTQLVPILLDQGIRQGLPYVQRILQNPTGTISRIGEMLVWKSPNEQHVIAGLASLSEGQSRIEQVVNHIDTVQIGMSHTLGVMHTLSIATLGVTSLSGALMLLRLQALNKRLANLRQAIDDVDDKLDAQNKAHLTTAINKLREFEDSPEEEVLKQASNAGQFAAAIYSDLALKEAEKKKPRIDVLNYRTRCYLLGLMAELQSRALLNQLPTAIHKVNGEKQTLQSIAKSTFEAVIQGQPEIYLRSDMAKEGVTLELMTELYQQALHAGAIAKPQVDSASDLFEHCRAKGIATSGWTLFSKKDAKRDASQLRYLMACLEEINGIDGMRLMMSEVLEKKASVQSLRDQIRGWWNDRVGTPSDTPDPVIAYAFA